MACTHAGNASHIFHFHRLTFHCFVFHCSHQWFMYIAVKTFSVVLSHTEAAATAADERTVSISLFTFTAVLPDITSGPELRLASSASSWTSGMVTMSFPSSFGDFRIDCMLFWKKNVSCERLATSWEQNPCASLRAAQHASAIHEWSRHC